MKTNKIIPVFFAVDDNYAKLLAISLSSIITNASKDYQYQIIVLNTGLNDESTSLLKSLENENFSIEFKDVRMNLQKIAGDLSIRDYYTKTTYYRLFIAELFPQFEKCLYLDCDTIITGDISELYNTNIGENLVGAVPDASVQVTPEFIEYTENALGIDHGDYFNAGVLIMNLRKMREESFEEEFISLIEKYSFEVAQDQDYLNTLCHNQVFYLNGAWNTMPFGKYNNDAKLIHFNLSFKPWKYEDVMYDHIFWDYAERMNLKDDIIEMRNKFTPEMQRRDLLGGQRLKELCIIEAKKANNYYNLYVKDANLNIFMRFAKKIAKIYRKVVD